MDDQERWRELLCDVDGKDVDGLGSCGAATFLGKAQLSPERLGAAWQEHGADGAQTA